MNYRFEISSRCGSALRLTSNDMSCPDECTELCRWALGRLGAGKFQGELFREKALSPEEWRAAVGGAWEDGPPADGWEQLSEITME